MRAQVSKHGLLPRLSRYPSCRNLPVDRREERWCMDQDFRHRIRDRVTVLGRHRYQGRIAMDGRNKIPSSSSSSSSNKIQTATFKYRLYSSSIAIRGRRIRRKAIGVDRSILQYTLC